MKYVFGLAFLTLVQISHAGNLYCGETFQVGKHIRETSCSVTQNTNIYDFARDVESAMRKRGAIDFNSKIGNSQSDDKSSPYKTLIMEWTFGKGPNIRGLCTTTAQSCFGLMKATAASVDQILRGPLEGNASSEQTPQALGPENFICPESLPTEEARIESLAQFLKWGQDEFGVLTVEQITKLRVEVLTEHKCKESLANIARNAKPQENQKLGKNTPTYDDIEKQSKKSQNALMDASNEPIKPKCSNITFTGIASAQGYEVLGPAHMSGNVRSLLAENPIRCNFREWGGRPHPQGGWLVGNSSADCVGIAYFKNKQAEIFNWTEQFYFVRAMVDFGHRTTPITLYIRRQDAKCIGK